MTDNRELQEHIGHFPTVTFGCRLAEGMEEVVGPLKPMKVVYGDWVDANSFTSAPMVVFNFNKYHSGLPNWDTVIECVLVNEAHNTVLVKFTRHLDTKVSGKLKTVQMGANYVKPGRMDGNTISREDVMER